MCGNKRVHDFPSSTSKRQRFSPSSSSSSKRQELSMSSSSSCSNSQWKYDVFLSFRGEDTRNNFTDHLYAALDLKGVYTFRDDERLERGKEISSELLKAIESSRFSIIILSKNYASSTRCLEELAKIVKSKDIEEGTVLPVKRWRSALTGVANLSGWHSQDRSEAELIKKIVYRIFRSLNETFENVTRDLIGINSHVDKIYELLEPKNDDIRFIGIWGMGGVGKSTIAKVVFEMLSYRYEGRCFLENVREELLSKVLNKIFLNICNDFQGINYIRRQLCCKRVFVVLDDVDDQIEQLENLAGKHDWFGRGSRIIVITRDKHVLRSHAISSVYEVKGLRDHAALQLFHMKAFRNKQRPPIDFADLSMKIIDYANGLPLALKQWKSALDSLEYYPDGKILKALRISYDGLEQNLKDIFLDIACFFKGKNKDRVMEILDNCNLYSTSGITKLVDKSLITISYNNICMHDLLQEMGWEIIREQHRDDRGKWSRLWLFEDVHHVLTYNRGTHEVKGLMLNKSEHRHTRLDGKSFSNMRNLRLLKISNVDLSEDLQYLSDELRFLKWPEYRSSSLPLNFQPWNLFELNLCRSRIKYLWNGMKKLDLEGCSRSRKVHETVGSLEGLTVLNLKGCKNLQSFPNKISGLKSLKILNLQSCSKLDKLPQNLGELQCLEELDASGTAIKQVPPSIARLTNLKTLSFRDCRQAPQSWISSFLLPRKNPNSMCLVLPSLAGLFNLKILDLSDCNLLEGALPDDLGSLRSLKELMLSNNNFVSLPESINQLSKLKILCLEKCQMLKSIPELPPKTIFVGAEDCTSLEDVSNVLKHSTSRATALHFLNCSKLLEDQGHENSLVVMLLKQYLQQPVNLSSLFYIPLPGREIPEWFSCRSDVNSVGIGLPPNWLNDEFMGIAMCAVIAPDPENLNDIRSVVCKMCIMRNKHPFHFYIPCFTTVESEHLWLVYASCEKFEHERSYQISRYLDYLQKVKLDPSYELPDINCRDLYVSVSNSTCIHAEFGVSTQAKNSNSKVIKCGIRPVYKKDIECFEESPPAESSKLHQSHNCSTGYHSSSTGWHMPTKLEYHCNIRRDYSGVGHCFYFVFLIDDWFYVVPLLGNISHRRKFMAEIRSFCKYFLNFQNLMDALMN
ncbi:hypothetical protein ACOSQ2_009369 [Xanthoceras sorbifolium]